MKKIILSLVCAIASTTSFAQSTAWMGARVSYGFTSVGASIEEKSVSLDASLSGLSEISAAFTYGLNVSESLPLFVEAAPEFNFITGDKDLRTLGETKVRYNQMSAGLPINVGVRLKTDYDFAFSPYIGLKAKYIFKSELKNLDGDEKIDLLDGDYKDFLEPNAFQLGWQVGCGVDFLDKYYLSVSYNNNFIKHIDKEIHGAKVKADASSVRITLGYNF